MHFYRTLWHQETGLWPLNFSSPNRKQTDIVLYTMNSQRQDSWTSIKKWLCYNGHRVALVVHRAQKSVPDSAIEWPTFLPPPLESCSGTANVDGPNYCTCSIDVEMGWVGLWGFLWWATSADRKDHHGVSSEWSSVGHCSNTGLSSTQYEQIPIIFKLTRGLAILADSHLFLVSNILAGLWLNCISSVEITLFLLADMLLQHRSLFQC